MSVNAFEFVSKSLLTKKFQAQMVSLVSFTSTEERINNSTETPPESGKGGNVPQLIHRGHDQRKILQGDLKKDNQYPS